MGAKQSSQTKRGIKLVKEGMSYYAAAKKVGVSPSTLYRATGKEKLPGESRSSISPLVIKKLAQHISDDIDSEIIRKIIWGDK